MGILFYAALLFLIAFLIHFLIWKIRVPKKQVATILYVYICVLIIGIVILNNFKGRIMIFGIPAPRMVYEHIYICILYLFLTLDYIVSYPAIEADAPSASIAMYVARFSNAGITRADIEKIFNEDILIKPRVNDLVSDKMIYLEEGKYRLNARGTLFIRMFIFYRNLLGLGKGG